MTSSPQLLRSSPIQLNTYEIIHESIRKYVQEKLLPKPTLFPKLIKESKKVDCYPIIIGGAVIHQCASVNAKAKAFVKDLFTEDIDIKIVIPNKAVKAHDQTKLMEHLEHHVRRPFVETVVKRLTTYLNKHKAKHAAKGWIVTVEISDALMRISNPVLQKKGVLSINMTYVPSTDTTNKVTVAVMDTAWFSELSASPQFNQYNAIRKRPDDPPVPTITYKGLTYCTCEYAYYDTVRMLVDRGMYLESTKSMFALMKVARYMIKFICLFVLLKGKDVKSGTIDPTLIDIYEKTHAIVKSINVSKLYLGDGIKKVRYDTPYVNTIGKLLDQVVKSTEMQELVAIVSKNGMEVMKKTGGGRSSSQQHRTPLQRTPFTFIDRTIIRQFK